LKYGTGIGVIKHLHDHTFHINLFDLALLGTIFIGFTFVLLLWFKTTNGQPPTTNRQPLAANRQPPTANRFLALALMTIILWMIRLLGIGPAHAGLQFSLALGPLIYFYSLKITRPEFRFRRKDLLHFTPLLLELGSPFNSFIQLLSTVSVIVYLYLSHRLIEDFYQRQKFNGGERARKELKWLDHQLLGFGFLWTLWLVGIDVYDPLNLLLGVMTVWMAAAAYLRKEEDVSKSALPGELWQKGIWLKKAMETGLYYQDAELSLSSLAKSLGIHPHELSRIINLALNKNFHEFINEYRIREVTRKMKNPDNARLTLLGIAFDAGFNSKATFNRTFKQIIGKNPAEYMSDLKNKRSTYDLRPSTRSAGVISYIKVTPMFKNYFKIALRNLARNKVYSFINIAGLSLGLASAMLIILYVKDEVSYDRFHNGVDRIYRVTSQGFDKKENKISYGSNTGYLQGPRYTAHIPELLSFVRVQSGRQDIRKGTDISSHDELQVDSNFFSMFSFPLTEGNAKTCLKDPHSVVLSEDEAKKQFGTIHALGKTLMMRDDSVFVPYAVTGIAKKCPQNSSIKFDILVPLIESTADAQNSENWFNTFLNTFVVLPAHADPLAVEKKMQKFYDEDTRDAIKSLKVRFGDEAGNWVSKPTLQPFLDMHLNKDMPANNGLSDASNPVYSYILSGIALFILLIASINFVNLTIARSVKRAKEIGIRKVVGGEKRQLIIQFLGESFLLCFLAFSLAILLVLLVLPVFNDLSNKSLALSYLFDIKLAVGYILLFLLTGFMAGFYPALVLSGYNPVQTLYSRFRLSGKNYLQKSLVVLQFSLASFLIIATFTIYSQFQFLTTQKLGYDDSNLVSLEISGMKLARVATFKDELLKNPGISQVTFKNGGDWGTIAKINADSNIQFQYEIVDESYIPMLKISLLKGRNFSKDFPSDSSHSVLVNEAFMNQAGWKNPIGQQVNFWYNKEIFTVIGVVKDYHYHSLNEKIGPQLFTIKAGNQYGMAFVKIRPGTETASLKYIQTKFKQFFPMVPYNYSFKADENYKSYEAERKWKQIMLFSAVLTIFISCIGLFGLSVLSAERRIKEIGIRKVLGASVNSVVTILSKDFVKLVLLALLIAIPLGWFAVNKWLQNYPYRIDISWKIFTFAGALVLFIALVTVSFQALKSAMANPVSSLRSE
jgi:putative ABC transport system permease protein